LITTQTGPQPVDFADVRATNLGVVLRHLRTHAPCSRADIAATTGLTKATVSSLVADLIERRLVRESGLTERRVGRPATMLVLDGQAYAAVGLEVDADHLTAVAVDLAGEQLLSWRRSLTAGARREGPVRPGRGVSAVAALAGRAVNRLTAQGRQVLRLTVGVPGLVTDAGAVQVSTVLGWRDVDLREDLIRALRQPGFEVSVDNDANLAALAEYRFGAFAGTPNLVHVTGEVGVGAGVIVDGRLLRGGRGFGGEIGHVQIEPDGPPCACGRRGCLESLASPAAIVARALPDATNGDLDPDIDEVVRRARQANRATLDVLARAGQHLGQGLAVVANLINPELIALGGKFVPLAPWLLPAAEAELLARVLAPAGGGCRLVASAVGQGAAAIGGAIRPFDELDTGRLPDPPTGTAGRAGTPGAAGTAGEAGTAGKRPATMPVG
jgi:predicted NBD/HSP70 family sugar kinase